EGLRADRAAPADRALRRARARLAAATARPLRRVQPDLRSRDAVRAQDAGPRRVDPDVAAAAGALGLRRDGHSRFSRGRAAHASPADRLARTPRLTRAAISA